MQTPRLPTKTQPVWLRSLVLASHSLKNPCFTNWHLGATGINAWRGTALNSRYPDYVPGRLVERLGNARRGRDCRNRGRHRHHGLVRIPAASCGVVGSKTTFGLIDHRGVYSVDSTLDTAEQLGAAERERAPFREAIDQLLTQAEAIALPTLDGPPPTLSEGALATLGVADALCQALQPLGPSRDRLRSIVRIARHRACNWSVDTATIACSVASQTLF